MKLADMFVQVSVDAKKFEESMRKMSAAIDESMRSMLLGFHGDAREALAQLSPEERDRVITATVRIRKSLPRQKEPEEFTPSFSILKHRGLAPVNCRCTNIYVTVA